MRPRKKASTAGKADWSALGEPEPSQLLLLTPREAALALRVSVRTVQILTGRGELPAVRIGRLVRYDVAALKSWIACRSAMERTC